MAGRDVGKMGQSEFEKLCASAGLTANVSREDKTGWDYLVEFPLPRSPGQPADIAPPALQCTVQVKATDNHRRTWGIALRNLERLAKSPIPAFICLLEFNGEEQVQHVYLVRVGEGIIGRVLKRLRQLERTSRDAAKKPSLSIACEDSHRLSQPRGACLKEAIERHVPDGLEKYSQRKKTLLDTLGYENGHPAMKVQFSSQDPIQDLLDLSLGYRKSLKVNSVSMHDVRFGVECILPDPHGSAELSLSSATSEGVLIFRERQLSPGIAFVVTLRIPSINHVLLKERISYRVQNKFFDILIQPFAGTMRFNLLPGTEAVPVSLSEAKDYLTLLHMMSVHGTKGLWMDLTVGGQDFLPGGRIFVQSTIHDPAEDLGVIEQALSVARTLGIDARVSVCIMDILAQWKLLAVFHAAVQGQVEGLVIEFSLDENVIDVQSVGGILLCGQLSFGDSLVHCLVGIAGSLEQVEDRKYRLTSRGDCYHRHAMTTSGQEVHEGEFADLVAGIEAEMKAEGIGPLIAVKWQ